MLLGDVNQIINIIIIIREILGYQENLGLHIWVEWVIGWFCIDNPQLCTVTDFRRQQRTMEVICNRNVPNAGVSQSSIEVYMVFIILGALILDMLETILKSLRWYLKYIGHSCKI